MNYLIYADWFPEVCEAEPAGHYLLRFRPAEYKSDPVIIEITLDAEALARLGKACLDSMPPLTRTAERTSPDVEISFRAKATFLNKLDDLTFQSLIGELSTEQLACFLWYMQDAALTEKLMRNCPRLARESLQQDLDHCQELGDPDQAFLTDAESGREAVNLVLETVTRIAEKKMSIEPGEA